MLNKKWLFLIFIVLLGIVIGYQLELFDYQDVTKLLAFNKWITGWGWLAPAFFIAIYTVAMIIFLPNPFFMLVGGLAFGSFFGAVFVLIGFGLGASSSFLIARYFARDFIKAWLEKKGLVSKMELWIEEYGYRLLLITRLIPIIPINLQNYAYGLTEIKFSVYIILSLFGILPKVAFLTVISGFIVEEGLIVKENYGIIIGGLIFIIVFYLLISKIFKVEEYLSQEKKRLS
ncbi:VTT domain-containing protein [Natroniella acetigena]|uniref:TVP38/TMEM64 family protein n=1 Tax=Natroniella acetigena TaxID=52004 RepID=UPI00200ABD40|nr:VTT domain-containing protein [Natroniella acetigena]MCK8828560.1 VTT domain-containing protein [Natroniella acetigena]